MSELNEHTYYLQEDFKDVSYILSQSYNATVFYFDNISFLEHVSSQLFLPNESSINQIKIRNEIL